MELSNLQPAVGSNKKKRRIGRVAWFRQGWYFYPWSQGC